MKKHLFSLGWRGVVVVVIAICLFAATPALAQSGASTGLWGVVTDDTGAAIPGVTITITRVETEETRTAQTGEAGRWETRFISPGSYQITMERRALEN